MDYSLSSIADFDSALLNEYSRFRSLFPDEGDAFVQRRFAQYGVFPKLGWALIGVGEAEALAAKDPSILYATITRFLKCAHHCWGPTDQTGLHFGGYDFCALVMHSLYSALLGNAYIASTFHCGRLISRNGNGAHVHAANLMVCIECPTWPFRARAVTLAEAFVASKNRAKTDKAFVSFFVAVLAEDRRAVAEALAAFSDGYGRSDWGRHKPWTGATFIQSMITYARSHVAEAVNDQTHRALLSEDRIQLWSAMSRTLDRLALVPHRFPEPLGFLDDLSIH